MVSTLGIAASLAIFLFGALEVARAGGWMASGGPYEIASPITPAAWPFPVGMTGLFLFPMLQKFFASRIGAPRLAYATIVVATLSLGVLAMWLGLTSGTGPEWGWIANGAILLITSAGLVIVRLIFVPSRLAEMTGGTLLLYWLMTAVSFAAGVGVGIWLGLESSAKIS